MASSSSGRSSGILPTTNPGPQSVPFSSLSTSDPFPPFSTSSSTTASTSSASASASTTSSVLSLLRALFVRTTDFFRSSLALQRPWRELLDPSSFSRPEGLGEAAQRIRRNLPFYRSNYTFILAVCTLLNLLRYPSALFTLVFLILVWSYFLLIRPGPLSLGGGRALGEREKVILLAIFSAFVAFGVSSLGSAVISACVIGSLLVLLHASFRAPDDLFLEDPATSSFSSASSASVISGIGGLGFDAVASGLHSMAGPSTGGPAAANASGANSFVSLLIASSSPKGNPPLYSPAKGSFPTAPAGSSFGAAGLKGGGGVAWGTATGAGPVGQAPADSAVSTAV